MNRRQKKKKLKDFFKKQGIKLKNNSVKSDSRHAIKSVIVYQSLEQLKK